VDGPALSAPWWGGVKPHHLPTQLPRRPSWVARLNHQAALYNNRTKGAHVSDHASGDLRPHLEGRVGHTRGDGVARSVRRSASPALLVALWVAAGTHRGHAYGQVTAYELPRCSTEGGGGIRAPLEA